MKKLVSALVLALSFISTGAMAWCQEQIEISYYYPSQFQANGWDPFTNLGTPPKQTPNMISIMNINSGLSVDFNQDYYDEMQDIIQNGYTNPAAPYKINNIVYLPLGYLTDPNRVNVLRTNLEAYRDNYPAATIKGVFFDELPSSAGAGNVNVTRMNAIYLMVADVLGADTNRIFVLNPGVYPDYNYLQQLYAWSSPKTILMTFEGNYTTYQTITPPAWSLNISQTKFAHVIYSVPNTTAAKHGTLALSKANNAGYVYLTNLDNSYSAPATFRTSVINKMNACDY